MRTLGCAGLHPCLHAWRTCVSPYYGASDTHVRRAGTPVSPGSPGFSCLVWALSSWITCAGRRMARLVDGWLCWAADALDTCGAEKVTPPPLPADARATLGAKVTVVWPACAHPKADARDARATLGECNSRFGPQGSRTLTHVTHVTHVSALVESRPRRDRTSCWHMCVLPVVRLHHLDTVVNLSRPSVVLCPVMRERRGICVSPRTVHQDALQLRTTK